MRRNDFHKPIPAKSVLNCEVLPNDDRDRRAYYGFSYLGAGLDGQGLMTGTHRRYCWPELAVGCIRSYPATIMNSEL